ncbi:hypothetical protein [Spiroplasma endosymbiont of Phyllotreta cruciferae]|uniref:hypothetical protein n=1 Tax=Spiroplasma endosymbiont of Phyllotreta cruciferae TaxID=2886375 RepID=UPI00209CC1B3|nr:hypothetical protein [Spiroplasma endosymbiont of Phyllotreta cruciferae]
MIKIGIYPSGTGTTAIVEFNKLREIFIETHHFKDWKNLNRLNIDNEIENYNIIMNIENCLYTNANGSKDRDDLLRLLGAIENKLNELQIDFN